MSKRTHRNPFDQYPHDKTILLGKAKDDTNCRHGYGLELQRITGQTACAYCDLSLVGTYEHWLLMSVDHVVPKRDMGDNGLGVEPKWIEGLVNRVLCCSACNQFLQSSISKLLGPTVRKPESLGEFVKLRDKAFDAKRRKAKKSHENELAFYQSQPWTIAN